MLTVEKELYRHLLSVLNISQDFLPSSKKLDLTKNVSLFIEGKLTRTCAPIDDPIEEWVMVVDVASGCLWSPGPWSAIRRRQSGLAGRQQARGEAGQANQGTGRGPSVTG